MKEGHIMKLALLITLMASVSCSHLSPIDRVPASRDQKELCGISGSVEERIEDCHKLERPSSNYNLVSVKDHKEIYQDSRSGLFWGPKLKKMKYDRAVQACEVFQAREAHRIPGLTWRLPTSDEFRTRSSGMEGFRDFKYSESLWGSDITQAGYGTLAVTMRIIERAPDNGNFVPVRQSHAFRCVAKLEE